MSYAAGTTGGSKGRSIRNVWCKLVLIVIIILTRGEAQYIITWHFFHFLGRERTIFFTSTIINSKKNYNNINIIRITHFLFSFHFLLKRTYKNWDDIFVS